MSDRSYFTKKCINFVLKSAESRKIEDMKQYNMGGYSGYKYNTENLEMVVICPTSDTRLLFIDYKGDRVLHSTLIQWLDKDEYNEKIFIGEYKHGEWQKQIEDLFRNMKQ